MKALKFVLSLSVFAAVVALATGVVCLFEERPDGTARFSPHVSRPAADWYAAKARTVARSEPALAVAAGVRRVASGD